MSEYRKLAWVYCALSLVCAGVLWAVDAYGYAGFALFLAGMFAGRGGL